MDSILEHFDHEGLVKINLFFIHANRCHDIFYIAIVVELVKPEERFPAAKLFSLLTIAIEFRQSLFPFLFAFSTLNEDIFSFGYQDNCPLRSGWSVDIFKYF
jgi:hypothetical protein